MIVHTDTLKKAFADAIVAIVTICNEAIGNCDDCALNTACPVQKSANIQHFLIEQARESLK